MTMEKIKMICVVGATASGKTALSVALAKALDGEIISADSMQVYRDMPIATAAATAEEQQGVPHHLLAFLPPEERFSVADYVALAKQTALDIHARGKVPVVAGGTGLFMDSLVKNIRFSSVGVNDDVREQLQAKSNEELYAMLQALDGEAAKDIHPNNRKRVIRALELSLGGVSKTAQNEQSQTEESPFDALYIGIGYRDRELLYNRINRRVDIMLADGLLAEAETCLQRHGATAKQAIGHKELQPYFDGTLPLEEAVENIKRETRRYAKRQLTWFRRNEQVHWLYADEMTPEALTEEATALCRAFLKD